MCAERAANRLAGNASWGFGRSTMPEFFNAVFRQNSKARTGSNRLDVLRRFDNRERLRGGSHAPLLVSFEGNSWRAPDSRAERRVTSCRRCERNRQPTK